ncbi:hypothetical protein BU15DRAFT_69607, partial [Melanogaster broomeanus]
MPPHPKAVIDFEVPEELPQEEVSSLFPSNIARGQKFHAWDARSIAVVPPYIITSPNMDYVPSYIFDGRWGYVDPFQMPQDFADEFPWAALVPRKDCIHNAQLKDYVWVIWHTPTPNVIRKEHRDHLSRLGDSATPISTPSNIAQSSSSKKSDRFQRERGRESGCCKFLVSVIRCNIELLDHIGWGLHRFEASLAFTLFQAGIPVWLVVRSISDAKGRPSRFPIAVALGPEHRIAGQARAYLSRPTGMVETSDYSTTLPTESLEEWRNRSRTSSSTALPSSPSLLPAAPPVAMPARPPSPPMHPRQRGGGVVEEISNDLLDKLSKCLVGDIGKAISPSISARMEHMEQCTSVDKGSQRNSPNIQGDSTWDDVTSVFLPDLDLHWNMGIARIDRSPHRINTAPPISGYPLPDVAVFGRTTSAERVARYTANWLFCRIPWARA